MNECNIKTSMNLDILSNEQKFAYEKYIQGCNLFNTGPGGTGKTKLIQYFVEFSKNRGDKLQVCAMTGCASILLSCNAENIAFVEWYKISKRVKTKNHR